MVVDSIGGMPGWAQCLFNKEFNCLTSPGKTWLHMYLTYYNTPTINKVRVEGTVSAPAFISCPTALHDRVRPARPVCLTLCASPTKPQHLNHRQAAHGGINTVIGHTCVHPIVPFHPTCNKAGRQANPCTPQSLSILLQVYPLMAAESMDYVQQPRFPLIDDGSR